MKTLFKGSIAVILLLVIAAVPVFADNELGEDQKLDVTVTVNKYAEVETSSIGSDDWIDFSAPEGETLKERLMKAEDITPTTNEGSSFVGDGGEVKWARQEVMIKANTPFMISATASYPEHTDGNSTLNSEFGKPKTFYAYLIKLGSFRISSKIKPEEVVSIAGSDTNGTVNYVLASKIEMPEEFWEVKPGNYLGNVTFTVQAK